MFEHQRVSIKDPNLAIDTGKINTIFINYAIVDKVATDFNSFIRIKRNRIHGVTARYPQFILK